MKPCETCVHFNMNECDYCNVEAYVEDGKPCPQYTTSCNPERLYKMIENANIVATEICEKVEECDSACPCFLLSENACAIDMLYKIGKKIKKALNQYKSDYRKDAKDDA